MTEKKNPADLAGAYALNALSPEEKAEFDKHLAESEPARIQATELSDTAVALGLAAAPVQPSAALKSALMAKIASTPQLPALPAAEATAASATTAPDAAPAPAQPAATVPAASAPPASSASPTRTGAAERARNRWFQRPAGFLLAAAAAIVLFVGGTFVGQAFDTNQFVQQQAAQLVQINAAPDSARASTTTKDGHPATLVWSGELGLSALMIKDLPALPSDKDYQLWLHERLRGLLGWNVRFGRHGDRLARARRHDEGRRPGRRDGRAHGRLQTADLRADRGHPELTDRSK